MICAKHMDTKPKVTVRIRYCVIILVMMTEDVNMIIQNSISLHETDTRSKYIEVCHKIF